MALDLRDWLSLSAGQRTERREAAVARAREIAESHHVYISVTDSAGRSQVELVLDLRVGEFPPCHNDLYGANIRESWGDLRLIEYDLSGLKPRRCHWMVALSMANSLRRLRRGLDADDFGRQLQQARR